MNTYSNLSESRLMTCDIRWHHIMAEVIKEIDNSIICGHRNAADQNAAYDSNNSQVKWPDSKHNDYPSKAIDAVPYPSMWDNIDRFFTLNYVIEKVAKRLGYKVRWGGDWDGDGDLDDQTLMDYGHWELID